MFEMERKKEGSLPAAAAAATTTASITTTSSSSTTPTVSQQQQQSYHVLEAESPTQGSGSGGNGATSGTTGTAGSTGTSTTGGYHVLEAPAPVIPGSAQRSTASDVLEKARNRFDKFWGKGNNGTEN